MDISRISKAKKVHVIGICGKGMSALAIMLREAGWEVTGSDAGFFDPVASYLKNNGQEFFTAHDSANIPEGVDVVVIGKHSKLVPETNSEVAEAFRLRDAGPTQVVSFPEMLSLFLVDTNNLVVAGSYGKSTCSALLAHILISAGRDPSYFVGAFPKNMEHNARLGAGSDFVLEGDEYPSSNFDDRSKFLWYRPRYVLFTSGEHDHVNVFPTLDSYLQPFRDLFDLLPDSGGVVACADNPHTVEMVPAKKILATYGVVTSADYTISNVRYGQQTYFEILKKGKLFGEFQTSLLGRHNLQNILGVVALLSEISELSLEQIQVGVASFAGVKRRLEQTNSPDVTTPVYETYGSSYAKARAGIDAIRLHFPNKKIVAVFEPHTFSWRDPAMAHWYDDVFADTDEAHILMPPVDHGKDVSGQTSPAEMERRIRGGENAPGVLQFHTSPEACLEAITTSDRNNSAILLITSGDLSGLTKKIPEFFT